MQRPVWSGRAPSCAHTPASRPATPARRPPPPSVTPAGLRRAVALRRRLRAPLQRCRAGGGVDDTLSRTALTLAVGAAGSLLALQLRAPLPYMLGPLLATAAASLLGAPLLVPPSLRLACQAVVGVSLGAGFDAALWSHLGALSATLAGLLAASAGATALGYAAWRAAGLDPTTALFAAVPGGLNDAVMVGAASGGDERAIATAHTVRLVSVTTLLPFALRAATGAPPFGAGAFAGPFAPSPSWSGWAPAHLFRSGPWLSLPPADALLLLLCGLLGPRAAAALRMPAAGLTGPLLLSALAHAMGVTYGRPPFPLLAAAQLVAGCAVGSRFAGASPGALRGLALTGFAVTAAQVCLCAAAAAAAAAATGVPVAALVLAFSPGGITEMSLTAAGMGLDAAWVAAHHLVRIAAVTGLAPAAGAALKRR